MRKLKKYATVISHPRHIRFYIPLYWIHQLGVEGEFRYDLVQAGDMLEMLIKEDGKYKILIENKKGWIQYEVFLGQEYKNLYDSEIVFFEKNDKGLRMYFINSEKYIKNYKDEFLLKHELHKKIKSIVNYKFKLSDTEECVKKLREKYDLRTNSIKQLIYALAYLLCRKFE